jgi:hypothetical protein
MDRKLEVLPAVNLGILSLHLVFFLDCSDLEYEPLTETSEATNSTTKSHIQEGVNLMVWIFCSNMILLCNDID